MIRHSEVPCQESRRDDGVLPPIVLVRRANLQPGVLDMVEPLEEAGQLLGGNAHAGVADR
jgi:hypothetical protein